VPDLCTFSHSSSPKNGLSLRSSDARASWISAAMVNDMWFRVLVHTSVVMECEASSSFPSRHHPLCVLLFPSSRAISLDYRRGGRVLLLAPSGWVRRIQLSVDERIGFNCSRSVSFSPPQLTTIGCVVRAFSPQIFSSPLQALLKNGGMVRAVSPWNEVA